MKAKAPIDNLVIFPPPSSYSVGSRLYSLSRTKPLVYKVILEKNWHHHRIMDAHDFCADRRPTANHHPDKVPIAGPLSP